MSEKCRKRNSSIVFSSHALQMNEVIGLLIHADFG